MDHPLNRRDELRGGIESTLLGLPTSIGPILLFAGILGSQSLPMAFWATLVTAFVMPALWVLLRGHPAVLPGTRAASLTSYIALVMQLGFASAGSSGAGSTLTTQQLLVGLAAGSFMFAAASGLILLIGLCKLGNIFKMIPSTVTSGVANGTALLLVWLGLKKMLHGHWSVTFTAGVMLLCFFAWPKLQKSVSRLRALPAILVATLAGLALGMNLEPMPLIPPGPLAIDFTHLAMQAWPALLGQQVGHLLWVGLPGTVTLALIMILETFTANSVMEARFGLRVDADRQLVVMGGANLAGAMLGGVPCTGSPIRCVANRIAGGRGVAAALTSLLLTSGLILAMGNWLLALPAGVIAGLFFLQAPMMVDMTFIRRLREMVITRQFHRDGAGDLGFWMIFLISWVGFLGGLIWACFLGIGLSALAVLRSVSSQLTAQWTDLTHYRSRRVRSEEEAANLSRLFHRVAILRLTGHLFFGNSARLTQLIDELHQESIAAVIDVSQVRDVDPSGSNALCGLVRALVERRLSVVLTGLSQTSAIELQGELRHMQGVEYRLDLDRGLEWTEELVLQSATLRSSAMRELPLSENQLLHGLSNEEVTGVLMLGECRQVAKDAALFHRGDAPDGIWLLQEGTVSILFDACDAPASTRLATFGPGQFVGEMGYIDGQSRSASARADAPVRALLLDQQAIAALIERQPVAALQMTRNIARELSHRVRSTSALMSDDSVENGAEWSNSLLSTASRF